jgi:hypothetical protein
LAHTILATKVVGAGLLSLSQKEYSGIPLCQRLKQTAKQTAKLDSKMIFATKE